MIDYKKIIHNENIRMILPYLGPMFFVCSLVLFLFFPKQLWLGYTAFTLSIAFFTFLLFVKRRDIMFLFKKKNFQKSSNSVLYILIVLAILGIVNFISSNHQIKKDFTRNQINSLSQQSIKTLKNLKKDVHFIAFLKITDAKSFEKLIGMYQFHSSKINYEIIDPNKEPIKTRNYNITKYGTIIATCSDGKETKFNQMSEEKITNALIKLTRKEKKTIYFIEGHGERSIDDSTQKGISYFKQALEEQRYTVKKLSLLSVSQIPEDAHLLVLVGPSKSMFKKEIDLLYEFYNKQGSLLVMSDPSSPKQPVKPLNNVQMLLDKFKIYLRNDLIIDPMSKLFGAGEAMPIVQTYDTQHKITKDFSLTTFFPFTQSINLSKVDTAKYEIVRLCKTTPSSWGEADSKTGKISYNASSDVKGPLTISAVIKPNNDKDNNENKNNKENYNELVIFGNSSFAANQFINHAGNADLILNTVSYLVKDEDLISIRPRKEEKGRFVMPVSKVNVLGIVSVLLMPLLILTGGIIFWFKRRKL